MASKYYSSQTDQVTQHDPGSLIILFDNRHCGPEDPSEDQMSLFQHARLAGLTRMGWPSWWQTPDLEQGKVRLCWFTVGLSFAFPGLQDMLSVNEDSRTTRQ